MFWHLTRRLSSSRARCIRQARVCAQPTFERRRSPFRPLNGNVGRNTGSPGRHHCTEIHGIRGDWRSCPPRRYLHCFQAGPSRRRSVPCRPDRHPVSRPNFDFAATRPVASSRSMPRQWSVSRPARFPWQRTNHSRPGRPNERSWRQPEIRMLARLPWSRMNQATRSGCRNELVQLPGQRWLLKTILFPTSFPKPPRLPRWLRWRFQSRRRQVSAA